MPSRRVAAGEATDADGVVIDGSGRTPRPKLIVEHEGAGDQQRTENPDQDSTPKLSAGVCPHPDLRARVESDARRFEAQWFWQPGHGNQIIRRPRRAFLAGAPLPLLGRGT